MQNNTITCKQHMHNMLRAKSIKASEEHYTRGMPYQAQMTKPAQNRAKTCQNSG